jgi:murein DD-endopeptidase MepM/ murein hydrolase activator NlpD
MTGPFRRRDSFALNTVLFFLVAGVVIVAAILVIPRVFPRKPVAEKTSHTPKPAAVASEAAGEDSPDVSPTPPPRTKSYAIDGGLHVVAFRVAGSLSSSLHEALPEMYKERAVALADRLSDALRWRLPSNSDLRRGDRIKLVFNPTAQAERSPIYGFWIKSGKLGKELTYIYFPRPGVGPAPYFDPQGQSIAEIMSNPPLGAADMERATVENLGKEGLFFGAPRGTEAVMPFAGRVLRLNWDMNALGRSVEVKYGESGAVAWFAYLDSVSDRASEGALLGAGEVIGRIGATGKAPRSGLLYRAFREADGEKREPISPLELHERKRPELPAADRVAFIAAKARLAQLFEMVEAE